jgi:hypothetical protein
MPGVTDSKAEAEKLLGLPSDLARDQVLGDAVADWAKKDPDAAFAFARQLPQGQGRNHATGEALKQIAKKDPLRAMQMANEMLPEYWNAHSTDVPTEIASEVAKKDFSAARQWVEQMPVEQRGRVGQPLAAKLVQTDPAGALEWGSANEVDLSSIMGEAMKHSSAASLQWIEAKPEGPDRNRLLECALSNSGNGAAALGGDTAKFNSLLAQLPPDARLRVAGGMGWQVGGGYKAKNGWGWIATLDDEPSRLEAIMSASAAEAANARWHPDAPSQTPEFSDAPSHDAAILGKARNLAPEKALETFSQISDPQTQQNAFNRYLPDWLHRDSVKAEAWLRQNGSFTQEQIDAWKEESQWAQ